MKYTYSKHTIQRMLERNITADEIFFLLSNNENILIVDSKKDVNVALIMGFINEKGIVIIINKNTNNIITVRKMRPDEKKLFKKED